MGVRQNSALGLFTLPQRFGDERCGDEGDEHDIGFVVAGEDPTPSLEPSEHPLDFVAPAVQRLVQRPGLSALRVGRHHRYEARPLSQLARGVVLVGVVHEQRHPGPWVLRTHRLDEPVALGRVARLARRQTPGDDIARTRGNQMKLGRPAPAAASKGLWAVFLGAPMPSGYTFMSVEFKLTASMRTCIKR